MHLSFLLAAVVVIQADVQTTLTRDTVTLLDQWELPGSAAPLVAAASNGEGCSVDVFSGAVSLLRPRGRVVTHRLATSRSAEWLGVGVVDERCWIWNRDRDYVAVLDSEATRVLTVIPIPARPVPTRYFRPLLVTLDSQVVAEEAADSRGIAELRAEGKRVLLHRRTDEQLLNLIDYSNGALYLMVDDESGVVMQQPWSNTPRVIGSSDGNSIVIVYQNESAEVNAIEVVIRDFNLRTGVWRSDSLLLSTQPLTDGAVDSVVNERSAFLQREIGTDGPERFRKQVFRPALVPPVARVVAASANEVWLELNDKRWSGCWLRHRSGMTSRNAVCFAAAETVVAASAGEVWTIRQQKAGTAVNRYQVRQVQ